MKVLNIAFDDYANFSYDNCQALRSVGIDAHSYKIKKHPFGYDKESHVVMPQQMLELIRKADIVQIMHTWDEGLRLCRQAGHKKIYVYHTGTSYRMAPKYFNTVFNPHVIKCFTDQCEFDGLGAKDCTYIATAIDVKPRIIKPVSRPFVFAHYPSNPDVKGTGEIVQMMAKHRGLNIRFDVGINKVAHKKQFERMQSCDVYIELYKPIMNGRPYGCYGVTAFEAAAMGKIVVTQNIREDVYIKEYGECSLLLANNQNEFHTVIKMLAALSPDEIAMVQTKTFNWLVKNHSYKATGERLKKHLKL